MAFAVIQGMGGGQAVPALMSPDLVFFGGLISPGFRLISAMAAGSQAAESGRRSAWRDAGRQIASSAEIGSLHSSKLQASHVQLKDALNSARGQARQAGVQRRQGGSSKSSHALPPCVAQAVLQM